MTSKTGEWTNSIDFTLPPLQNWANGIISWPLISNVQANLSLNSSSACHDCLGLVTIDQNGEFVFQVAYFLIAQFSRFIRPGAVVLDTSSSSSSLVDGVASLNQDLSRSVVIVNRFGFDISLVVDFMSGDTWLGDVPGNSTTTWILPEHS